MKSIFQVPGLAAAIVCGASVSTHAQSPSGYDWSGLYVGAHFGGAVIDGNFLLPPNQGQPSRKLNDTDAGVAGGGQIGWNLQTNSDLVLGLEADVTIFGLEAYKRETYPTNNGKGTIINTMNINIDWLTTIRGRSGLRVGEDKRTLIYATGGLAIAEGTYSGTYARTGVRNPFLRAASDKETSASFAVGAGIEHAFSENVSFKLEGMYIGLETFSVPVPRRNLNNTPLPFEAKPDIYIGRVGINWRF
jgi:outer membrane immunogenic protein